MGDDAAPGPDRDDVTAALDARGSGPPEQRGPSEPSGPPEPSEPSEPSEPLGPPEPSEPSGAPGPSGPPPGRTGSRRPVGPMVIAAGAVLLVLLLLIVVIVVVSSSPTPAAAQCTVTAPPNSPGLPATYTGSPEQFDNAATIVGVGRKLEVPDRAVTVALATAIQESSLANLRYGDRDSVGLFQQRPSQGWGSVDQLVDTEYATTAFYEALLATPNWMTMDVTAAAQRVQRSGYPEAYADHEPEARVIAVALLGQSPAALTCTDLDLTAPPREAVAALATTELGTARLSGPQPAERGWAIASWLVAHAQRLALDQVSFDGRSWSAASGTWEPTGPADGRLSLRRVGEP